MSRITKINKALAVLVLSFLIGMPAFAQQGVVRGTVVDASGEPMIGAAVVVEGTNNGVSTDADGSFALSAASNAILEVSSIGFKTQRVLVSGRTFIAITLEEDTEFLDETVVIGYSVQRKSNVTGAIAAVKSQDMINRSSENAGEALVD